jgi:SAM-dependent methyltransferase
VHEDNWSCTGKDGVLGRVAMIRRVEGRRLAWYGRPADQGYWAHHWSVHFSEEVFAAAESGSVGYFEKVFRTYLPRDGRVIEAGCGLGQYVLALQVLGYDIEGIEWDEETVERVKAARPQLPIRTGDVTRLSAPDGWYSGYVSLGVVEHRQDGPEPFLAEAWRVLEPQGIALISVPRFHMLRRLKAALGLYDGISRRLEFYQYAFTESEFDGLLGRAGFEVIDHFSYSGYKGLTDEIPQLSVVAHWPVVGSLLYELYGSRWLDRHFGHMTMTICRKMETRSSPSNSRELQYDQQ